MKYTGIVLLLLIGILVSASWNYFQSFVSPANADIAIEKTIKDMLKQTKRSTQDINSLAMTTENIKKLQQAELKHPQIYSKLVALPVIPKIDPSTIASQATAASKIKNSYFNKYTVSMVLITPTDRYAVVDGRFAHEGDILTGKDRLVRISEGKIAVLQQGKLNTINVSGATQ